MAPCSVAPKIGVYRQGCRLEDWQTIVLADAQLQWKKQKERHSLSDRNVANATTGLGRRSSGRRCVRFAAANSRNRPEIIGLLAACTIAFVSSETCGP
jgi:hypothetical protein